MGSTPPSFFETQAVPSGWLGQLNGPFWRGIRRKKRKERKERKKKKTIFKNEPGFSQIFNSSCRQSIKVQDLKVNSSMMLLSSSRGLYSGRQRRRERRRWPSTQISLILFLLVCCPLKKLFHFVDRMFPSLVRTPALSGGEDSWTLGAMVWHGWNGKKRKKKKERKK